MQVKALLCKEEAKCEHDPETLLLLWTKAHLKWIEAKWKTVLWSDGSKREKFVVELMDIRLVISTQFKACISDGMGLHSRLWNCQLAHLERLHQY